MKNQSRTMGVRFQNISRRRDGRLRVTVSQRKVYFLRGLPPCDLSANRATLHQLRTRKHTLLNGSNGTDNWIQICVRQYLPGTNERVRKANVGVIRYRHGSRKIVKIRIANKF